jgi:hypothetical protein
MKPVALLLITAFFSGRAFAGDLNLNCFKNGDQGDYINDPVPYMQANTASQIIDFGGENVVVLVQRSSLFEGYNYDIIRINKANSSFTTKRVTPDKYNDWVEVADGLDCQVDD